VCEGMLGVDAMDRGNSAGGVKMGKARAEVRFLRGDVTDLDGVFGGSPWERYEWEWRRGRGSGADGRV
jgi:hypothetical protein